MRKLLLRDNFQLFFNSSWHAFLVYLFLLLLFAAFRLIFLFFFNSSPHILNETGDLLRAFHMGLRFDTMVACYGLLPVMFFNLAGIFTQEWGRKYFTFLKKIYHIYYTVLILTMLCVSVIDLYFYNFFQTRISILIFGFLEDDTAAVLQSIWNDYPLVSIIIGLIIAGFIAYKLVGYIQKKQLPNFTLPLYCYGAALVVMGFLFIYGIRGNFEFYPLRHNDTVISKYVFINTLVPNGVYATKTAFRDRKSQDVNINIGKTMKKWGFSSPNEAVSTYLGRNIEGNTDSLKQALTASTPVNSLLEQEPPNVIFVMMESMSEHFISLHNREKFNLLGKLEDVLPECIHFTHFLSATDATIHSLEALLINSPMTPVSQSIYMDRTLETSAAKPFKQKGYHTSFVSGSKLGWRNLDKFVPLQYIDNAEGSVHIAESIPNASSNEWGCFDEFMFMRIHEILKQGAEKPQFIFGMTITNHTPYSLPGTYTPYPLEIPEDIKRRLSSPEDHARIHFLTYQYANDCLGKFIAEIIESPLGQNTIIAVSGDHSARRIFDYPDSDMLQRYAVPLLLYIPEKYRNETEMPDVSAFASHKDIFPTVYHLALSEATYVRSGVNLFDKEALADNFAISSYNLVMNNQGAIFGSANSMYYVWTDAEKTQLKPADNDEAQQLEKVMRRGKAYTASMTYLVQEDLKGKEVK